MTKITIEKPKNFAEYDAIIEIFWELHFQNNKSEFRKLGFIPFYKNYEQSLSKFMQRICKAIESLETCYSDWPDGSIHIKLQINLEEINMI